METDELVAETEVVDDVEIMILVVDDILMDKNEVPLLDSPLVATPLPDSIVVIETLWVVIDCVTSRVDTFMLINTEDEFAPPQFCVHIMTIQSTRNTVPTQVMLDS